MWEFHRLQLLASTSFVIQLALCQCVSSVVQIGLTARLQVDRRWLPEKPDGDLAMSLGSGHYLKASHFSDRQGGCTSQRFVETLSNHSNLSSTGLLNITVPILERPSSVRARCFGVLELR